MSKEDLGLQRIGVLELVNEDMREARLELGSNGERSRRASSRLEQQIEEVELAELPLDAVVLSDERLEIVVQARGEVGVRASEHASRSARAASRSSMTLCFVTPFANCFGPPT